MVNEEMTRIRLEPTFALDGAASGFPLGSELDLAALRPAARTMGRLLIHALTPCADALALGLAFLVIAHLREAGLAWALLTFSGLTSGRSYRPRPDLRASRDLRSVASWIAIGSMGALLLSPAILRPQSLVGTGAIAFGLLIGGRLIAYRTIHALRGHHIVSERTLIVGAGPLSAQLATTLADHPEFGLRPVGFLDSRRIVVGASMPVLGDYTDLARTIEHFRIRRVVIGFGRNLDVVNTVRACQALPVKTHVIARGGDLGVIADGEQVDDVMGISLVSIQPAALTQPHLIRIKRTLDIVAAFVLLALSAPLFVGAAAAVRLSSPGPVFFRQRRVGGGGKPFDLLKFRSMRVNSDSDTCWSVAHDQRVTPIGRILRKTSIDELPQLYNVLRGDMSLIGPRPERPHFVEQFGAQVPHYRDRHRAPVGITGLAQVNKLRGDTSIAERIRLDNAYIERWSPWLDVMIALRTIGAILGGGA